MDHRLLELLVCPVCKGPLVLWRESQELACRADRLAFPIHDGLPVMLEAEARSFDPDAPHAPAPLGEGPDGGCADNGEPRPAETTPAP